MIRERQLMLVSVRGKIVETGDEISVLESDDGAGSGRVTGIASAARSRAARYRPRHNSGSFRPIEIVSLREVHAAKPGRISQAVERNAA
jgi:hypothetical protein